MVCISDGLSLSLAVHPKLQKINCTARYETLQKVTNSKKSVFLSHTSPDMEIILALLGT